MQKLVAKHPIFGMNQDDDDAVLKPGFAREIRNAIPRQGGQSRAGGIQNTPGSVLRTNSSLPAGNNTCIGALEDSANNRIFYFLYNSSSSHSIWYFSPNDNTHTLVMQSQYLNFNLSYHVNSSSCIEDVLTWTDGYNKPRMIVVADAVAGVYDTASSNLSLQIAMKRFSPPVTITAARSTDASKATNNVCTDSYQFVFKFVYRDNTSSLFSPPSKTVLADPIPDVFQNSSNRITLTVPINAEVTGIIKKVQLAYIKNNDGNYWNFLEIDHDGSSLSYTEYFYNTEPIESVQDYDKGKTNFVPDLSKNVVVSDQRILTTMNTYDNGFEDVGTSVLSVSAATTNPSRSMHVPNSSYTYGLVYFDELMATNGVVKSVTINLGTDYANGFVGTSASPTLAASWSITGNPPSWAKYYCIVRKKNNTMSEVLQTSSLVLFYKRDIDTAAGGEVVESGKAFYADKASVPSVSSYSGDIYLKLPVNIPISLDQSYRVRLITNIGQTKTEPIKQILGDKIVVGNFGVTNWSSLTGPYCYPMIQLEKYTQGGDEFFYEVGSIYTITSGAHDTTSGTEYGDHHLTSTSVIFNQPSSGALTAGYSYTSVGASGYTSISVLSPSPTSSLVNVSVTDSLLTVEQKNVLNTAGLLAEAQQSIGTVTTVQQVFALDYSKKASDNSRAWIEVKNKKTNTEPNTISISDKYVLNSQVNGLNKFSTLYSLPPNRSPVRKLISLGASGLVLAIHERSTTVLAQYRGDRILNSPDGSQLQSLINDGGKSVIGYDNELMGGYGTIHPESVVEHGGRAFWFDAYRGEACRYAANGVTPIGSKYNMRTFFSSMGDIYISQSSNRHVYGAYDTNIDMFVLTFRSDDTGEEETIGFIDRDGEERWVSLFDYRPERYIKVNSRLFYFLDGAMWEIGVGGTYNNFNGVQNTTMVKMIMNDNFSHEKILRNIGTETNTKWSVPSIISYKIGGPLDQETELTKDMFIRRDDAFYADVRRDKNTAGMATNDAWSGGAIMIGKSFEVTFENDDTDLAWMAYANFGYQPSLGHKIT